MSHLQKFCRTIMLLHILQCRILVRSCLLFLPKQRNRQQCGQINDWVPSMWLRMSSGKRGDANRAAKYAVKSAKVKYPALEMAAVAKPDLDSRVVPALEVVDVDQKTKLVAELDGSIMKCIEYVPQDRIQFVISSFSGEVVSLSTHPYGCRVMQRVLEHCDDPKTQQIIMDEIMNSVCTLAQDQYGNYVVQAIMKDQFGNYVVQKVLEACDAHSREIILSRIKVHLDALKRYTYGRHIVSRVEKLVTAAERHIALSSSNSSRGIST